jgi:hypothetical protein
MSSEFEPVGSWERVAAELRACKESQQRAWGDVDNVTLGRYLAGELPADERGELEQALDKLPELRKLTNLVQDVLRDLGPIEDLPPLAVPESAPPAVLPFALRRPSRQRYRYARYAPLAAAACLLLVFGTLMPRPGFLSAPRSGERRDLGQALAARSGPDGAVTPEAPLIFLHLPQTERAATPTALPAAKMVRDGPRSQAIAVNPPPPSPQVEWQSPAALNQTVAQFYVQGEVDQAERTLREAHRQCKKKFGPQHRNTRWTARQLAGVYQVALNAGQGPPPPPEPRSVAPGTWHGAARKVAPDVQTAYARAQVTARRVREQITSRPAQEVTTRVVPVLTQALRTSSCCEERQALVRALGELGPTARPAVALLTERLRKSSDPAEQRVLLQTLEKIGAVPNETVTALAAMATPPAPVTMMGVKDGPPRYSLHARPNSDKARPLSADEVRLARQVLSRLTGTEAQVGVFDSAGLFSVRGIVDTTRALRHLVRHNEVAVRIETRKSAAELSRRDQAGGSLGPRTVHILLDDSGDVTVRASPDLREQGLDPDQLCKRLAALCKKHEADRALRIVLTDVGALKPGKKKPR